MIVAIEGMDGVGKTTVAKSVEKDLLFEYVKDPLKELFEIDNEHLTKISDKIKHYESAQKKQSCINNTSCEYSIICY